MTLHSVDLRKTGQFPALLLDYLEEKPELKKFYNVFPNIENAREAIRNKQDFELAKRETLVEVLTKQYHGLPSPPDFSVLLDKNTFTVTTGHQLSIFTGPLYIIYKIVTTIKLANALKEAYPEHTFVPVYWMASEDHDFEEIAYFHLFGKTHKWTGEHKGAVGRLNPKELEEIIKQMPDKPALFARAYRENDTLTNAVRCYMHELFGMQGLVCLDADDALLKRHFLPVIKEELTDRPSVQLVSETTSQLAALGYQTPLNARDINLFYLKDDLRERITYEGNTYKILNTALSFSESEILETAEQNPEYFSPNVVLRPLYEEVILPNLAYIGGPSEVPYWMQLKGIFDHYQVPFPMLIPRNFGMYITNHQSRKIQKLGIRHEDLFQNELLLKRLFVENNTDKVLDLNDQKQAFHQVFNAILEKATKVDQTMEGAVKAEQTRLIHSLEKLEKRIRKAEERNYETEISQLVGLKHKLFPNGTAQERYDNLLDFYINDPEFIQKLFKAFDPLDFKYYILSED